MALTVCFKCDNTYLEGKDYCPHCGCFNFFCDEDTMPQAVHYLCNDLQDRAAQEKLTSCVSLKTYGGGSTRRGGCVCYSGSGIRENSESVQPKNLDN